jgi:hypothetical protein
LPVRRRRSSTFCSAEGRESRPSISEVIKRVNLDAVFARNAVYDAVDAYHEKPSDAPGKDKAIYKHCVYTDESSYIQGSMAKYPLQVLLPMHHPRYRLNVSGY